MAVTLISAVHGDIADSLSYATNEEKTTERRGGKRKSELVKRRKLY